MNFFTNILSSLIALCYRFLGSYTAAIILFTVLTKVILFIITLGHTGMVFGWWS